MESTSAAAEWFSTATNFKTKYGEFKRLLSALQMATIDPAKYPELSREREILLTKGATTNRKIADTVQGIETAYNAVKNTLGTGVELISAQPIGTTFSKGWEMVTDWADDLLSGVGGLGALGVLPVLIPIAVIAGSLTAISYWITDAQKFQAKIEEQKRLEAQGIDPRQAAKMVEQKFGTVGGKLIGDLGTVAKLAGIAGILFIGYKIATQTKLLKG